MLWQHLESSNAEQFSRSANANMQNRCSFASTLVPIAAVLLKVNGRQVAGEIK